MKRHSYKGKYKALAARVAALLGTHPDRTRRYRPRDLPRLVGPWTPPEYTGLNGLRWDRDPSGSRRVKPIAEVTTRSQQGQQQFSIDGARW